jgi:hypothetical protein
MSSSQTVDRNASHLAQAQGLLLPVAAVVFLFTVSYPANDFITASKPSDIGLGMFLVYAAIAGMTVGVLFLLVLPWAFRREASGGLALALAIVGAALAPGFWTGFPPGFASAGALLGWSGVYAHKARTLSRFAFGIGLLGMLGNVLSYAVVFI